MLVLTLFVLLEAKKWPGRPTQVLTNLKAQAEDKDSVKITFGSCYGIKDWRTDIFKTVLETEPDVWIWGGDAAYVDNVYEFSYNKIWHAKEPDG